MTSNPTPTPLASTAMEAARDIHEHPGRQLTRVEHVGLMSRRRRTADLIEKHLQPLLAKVEAERDEAVSTSKHCELGYKLAKNQQQQAEVAVSALLADLAAKEAALGELQKQLTACADERLELIEGIVHAISLVGTHTDEFCDEDPPEMASGSPELESLHYLRGHLEGSLIGDDGEYLARDKFQTTTKT